MKTIIVGLGNPILGDDGVGWKVAEEVRKQLPSPPAPLPLGERCRHLHLAQVQVRRGEGEVNVEFLSLGGISLMEHLIGYERAILIDAIASDQEPGSVMVAKLSELPDTSALHTASIHDTSLQNALKLGRAMGANLPEDIMVVGILTNQVYEFREELSPAVANAVPSAVTIVIDLL